MRAKEKRRNCIWAVGRGRDVSQSRGTGGLIRGAGAVRAVEEDAEGESPLAQGPALVSSAQPASFRLEPERRGGEAGWREAQGGSCLFTRPNLRRGGRGEANSLPGRSCGAA